MRLFHWIFRQTPVESASRLRSVCVYYDAHRMLILSEYLDKVDFSAYGEPMAIFGKDVPAHQIGEQVLRSLSASRGGLNEDQTQFITSQMLQRTGLKNIEVLGSEYDLICVSQFEGENIVISALHRYRSGGHGGHVRQPLSPHFPPEADRIGQFISEIVNGPPPALLSDSSEVIEEGTSSEKSNEAATTETDVQFDWDFREGDRVVDSFGHRGTVVMVDPEAEHGLGAIRVQFDDGRTTVLSAVAHGLTRYVDDDRGA